MSVLFLSLFFIGSNLYLLLFRIRSFYPVLLVFPALIDSYTLILPGLMWKDVALLFWVPWALIIVRRIGMISVLWGALLFTLLIINLIRIANGEYDGMTFSAILTPLHLHLPWFVLVLLLENRISGVERIWNEFHKILPVMVVIAFVVFAFASVMALSTKDIPGVATSAGFASVIHAFWLAFAEYPKSIWRKLAVSMLTFVFILISETRGALVLYVLLTAVVIFVKGGFTFSKNNEQVIVGPKILFIFALPLLLLMPLLFDISSFLSIINIYHSLFILGGEVSAIDSDLISGDKVRVMLWMHSAEVWFDNFWIGVGLNQYDSSVLFTDRSESYSPHHIVLSTAVDGGVIALVASFLPQIFVLSKTRGDNTIYGRMLFHLSWIYIVMSFAFGYSINYVLVIALYIYWYKRKFIL